MAERRNFDAKGQLPLMLGPGTARVLHDVVHIVLIVARILWIR